MALCEMCGKESKLILADIEGGELRVCSGCAKYGIVKKGVKKFNPASKFKSTKDDVPQFKVVDDFSALIRSAREKKGMKHKN